MVNLVTEKAIDLVGSTFLRLPKARVLVLQRKDVRPFANDERLQD